jgi:hypothetical protein
MNILKKLPVFSFYYILPTFMGFSAGLIYRDKITLNVEKKISMSLADYYLEIEDRPNKEIKQEFPSLERLMEKAEKKDSLPK